VVDQRPAEAALPPVLERLVEEVAVEEDDAPGTDLDRNRILVAIGIVVGFRGEIVLGVLVLPQRPEDAGAVRAGNDPQAAIVDRGVVERDPGGAERAVAGRDEVLVLVPGLPGLAGVLDEQHRLHALDVRPDAAGQHLDDAGMGERLPHQRRQLVREVDGEEAAHVVRVAAGHVAAGELGRLLPAEAHGLAEKGVDLVPAERAMGDAVAVLAILRGKRLGAPGSVVHRRVPYRYRAWFQRWPSSASTMIRPLKNCT